MLKKLPLRTAWGEGDSDVSESLRGLADLRQGGPIASFSPTKTQALGAERRCRECTQTYARSDYCPKAGFQWTPYQR
jgi:hypothetical protein